MIRAPIDGVVAKNVAEVGQRVARRRAADDRRADPGQAYVDANFKEGQLRAHAAGPAGDR